MQELVGEGLVHNHRRGVPRDLFGEEVAAGDPADPHGAEESFRDRHFNGTNGFVRAAGKADDWCHDPDHGTAHGPLLRQTRGFDRG